MNWEAMIRKAVKQSKLTKYAIAKTAGVAYPRLFQFVKGDGISLDNAQKICGVLGLELRPKARKGR